jgi:hypothetical protein
VENLKPFSRRQGFNLTKRFLSIDAAKGTNTALESKNLSVVALMPQFTFKQIEQFSEKVQR